MTRDKKIKSDSKVYSVIKQLEYILFGVIIYVIGTYFILYALRGGYRTLQLGRMVSTYLQLDIVCILAINIINIIFGVLLLILNYFGKKDPGKNSLAFKFIKLGIICLILMFILYFAISMVAAMWSIDDYGGSLPRI